MQTMATAGLLAATALAASVLLAPSLAHASTSEPGPFAVAQRNVTVSRTNGSTFAAQVRYPATATTGGSPFDPAAAPAPAFTFGHGFLTPVDRYDSTLDHLASHGYIVIATTSGGELFPNHANYAADMRHCLTYLETQAATKGSWLAGAVDAGAFGVGGHSMGGGASMLAAAADARIRCSVTYAGAETNPSAAAAALSVQWPAAFLVGSDDAIVAPATTEDQYDGCDAPRRFQTIAGGSHCGFLDSPIIACDSGSITREEQLAKTRELTLAFLDAHLRRDADAFARTWGEVAPVAGTTVTRDARLAAELGAAALAGEGGEAVETTLVVTNAGPDATAIAPRARILGDGGATGAIDLAFVPAESAPLAAGESATFTVRATSRTAATATFAIDAVRTRDGAGLALALATTFEAPANPADLDGDGLVGGPDLAILLGAWGPCTEGAPCPADLDASGTVGATDLATLLSSWG